MRRQGLNHQEITEALEAMQEQDADWRSGRTWSLVYSAGDQHDDVISSAYSRFFHENGLSPTAFPSLERMEREVVQDLLGHVGADPSTAGGTMASGGTESIILAMKAYRDSAGVSDPSIVVPSTAHPAFAKAAELLGLRALVVPVGNTYRADVDAMATAVDTSSIALVASAPAYPYGLVDPILELGQLAERKAIGLHVDACLGGVPLPFLRDMGRKVDPFDFSVPGVTSMSIDLHKYGYGAKGASAVLYRHRHLRNSQFSVFTDWPGGALTSPTLLGTRPGGAIAAAWAAINHLGYEGYERIFREIMATVDHLIRGLTQIGDLEVVGEPPMSVFAVTSQSMDIFAVADMLEEKGWRVDRQTDPDCIHHIVNPRHSRVVDEYLNDFEDAYRSANESVPNGKRQASYGVTSRVSASGDLRTALIEDLARRYDA